MLKHNLEVIPDGGLDAETEASSFAHSGGARRAGKSHPGGEENAHHSARAVEVADPVWRGVRPDAVWATQ